MKSVKVYLYVSAPPEQTDPQYVCVSHMKIRWGRHRQTPIYPIAQLDALKFAPTSTVSPSKTTAARDAEWTSTSSAAKAKRGREMQLAVVQIKAARAAHKCGLCARGEHDFSSCTKCRLCKNDGHWAQDCPEARKADWKERNGEQERRGRVTGIQPATKKGSKNLLTHTHNTLTYTDSNTALCNEETLANPLCVIVEDLNKAMCNEEKLANPLCVSVWKFWIRLSAMKTCLQTVNVWLLKFWIRPCDLPCEPRMTDLVFESTSASGH